MKVYDISMTIGENMMVYKNDASKKPQIKTVKNFEKDQFFESDIQFNLHTGTHLDAPLHMMENGASIDVIPVQKFMGACTLFDLSKVKGFITRENLEALSIAENTIVLFKTHNSYEETFNREFVYLSAEAAEFLVEKRIKGVGIDGLGIERSQPDHLTHKILMTHEIFILEGLRLAHVPEGQYYVIALPLKLAGLEASPTRAILIKQQDF